MALILWYCWKSQSCLPFYPFDISYAWSCWRMHCTLAIRPATTHEQPTIHKTYELIENDDELTIFNE
eukprot:2219951-Amphidinium_carterae.1